MAEFVQLEVAQIMALTFIVDPAELKGHAHVEHWRRLVEAMASR